MLEKRAFPKVDCCRGTNIEDWRLMLKQNMFSCPSVLSSLEENDICIVPPKLRDICLDID
ncbi:hypothetical protein MtrunA17_Chr4g0056291 [Medicago truncatula]|nr:hypothetical protein MtrunA17_Chr4g0056291 [Medicago truncatula]